MTILVRQQYPGNYDREAASDETALDCTGDPGYTQQQFGEEVDINTIVRRFGLTGQLPENGSTPAYGDFDEVIDYQTAMNMVRRADEAFMALPADIRYRFANDPQMLMEFVSDARNLDEAKKLGLVKTLSGVPVATQIPPKADPDPPAARPADSSST